MNILGISAYYHDSAACLVQDGKIIAAAQEERFTRKKHDHRFPAKAIEYCLSEGNLKVSDIDLVAFYDKPFVKFERLLQSYMAYAPFGLRSFLMAMPLWVKQKLWTKEIIKRDLGYSGTILFPEHHESHAASAFFPSPYQEAAFLTIDGVGEWATTSYGVGKGNHLQIHSELHFPHSLGLLYSAFTYYTGFKVNSGEYKVMGLAPYGEPRFKNLIYDHLLDLKSDGSFRLNMEYFHYVAGLTMTNEKFHKLFGGPPRKPESQLTQREMDLAASIQVVTEEIMLKMAHHVYKQTGQKNLCLAGGVALNCVGNGRIVREGPFEKVWVQPAAGDAGGALGAALMAWHVYLEKPREADNIHDTQKGSMLGPGYSRESILDFLNKQNIEFEELSESELPDRVSDLIAEENVVGWFHGRMEFGPRALGARSILGDPRSEKMQEVMNLKIKFRESFRPFAPVVLEEKTGEYFDFRGDSPYMLMVAPVHDERRIPVPENKQDLFGIEKLKVPRSDIPAVTHVDYSARLQTLNEDRNGMFYRMVKRFDEKFGCPVMINTSFNVRGEPIVCTPENAYLCFMRTHMDFLVLGNFLISKSRQKPLEQDVEWQKEFELD